MAKTSTPLVSVIIPVYGTEHYLERCVRSVVDQTYTNLEIILINDGSPDKCPMMCDEYAQEDSRIKVIHQRNSGQGVARNHGLDVCTGEYIMFVDSDDYIEAGMVGGMVNAALVHHCDLVLCGWKVVTGRITSEWLPYKSERLFSGDALMREYLTGRYAHSGPVAKLLKREVIGGVRFPAIRAREDAYIMHELLGAATRTFYMPKPYYVQVRRVGSTQASPFTRAMLVSSEVGDRIVAYTDANYPALSVHARCARAYRMAALMREIRVSGSVGAYYEDYVSLRTRLREEGPHLTQCGSPRGYADVERAARDGLGFKVHCVIRRIRREVMMHVARTGIMRSGGGSEQSHSAHSSCRRRRC